jgi:diguanylate cyclase (GGDEF)-like protein
MHNWGKHLRAPTRGVIWAIPAQASARSDMRLASDGQRAHVQPEAGPRLSPTWSSALVVAALLLIFALDRSTGSAPVQHLYYLPIVFAAIRLGQWAGPIVALGAVLLYHLASPVLLTARYMESDFVQIALFLAVGVVAAKFTRDARRLRRLAITDDLTGLYNLRGFEARLAAMVAASRVARTPLALLVLDVDRLKSLNDAHGHLAGADAVRVVGQILAERLQDGAIASRFGGDEFVVALPGPSATEAHETADDLRRAVHSSAPVLGGLTFPAATLSISIGLAYLSYDAGAVPCALPSGDTEAGEALFRAADQALYVAKNSGRNRVSGA